MLDEWENRLVELREELARVCRAEEGYLHMSGDDLCGVTDGICSRDRIFPPFDDEEYYGMSYHELPVAAQESIENSKEWAMILQHCKIELCDQIIGIFEAIK